MLKVTPNPTFDASVEVPVPGQTTPEKITVTFTFMNQGERDEFLKKLKDLPEIDALLKIVQGWKGVEDDFSRPVLENMLVNYSGLGTRLIKAFFDEHHKALLGN